MKQFKNLDITGPDDGLRALINHISENLPAGWNRDHKAEAVLDRLMREKGEEAGFAFVRDAKDNDPPSGLFLDYDIGRLHVPNIVPQESGALSIAQYNRILDEFAEILRNNLPANGELAMNTTTDDFTITNLISPKAEELLKRFSGCANKSTGSAHPRDFQRWAAFLVRLHREGSDLPVDILERWLTEELNWAPDMANKLVLEYEFALGLLRIYDDSE